VKVLSSYPALQETLEKKMEVIATRIYGADGIELSQEARKKVELYTNLVTDILLACIVH